MSTSVNWSKAIQPLLKKYKTTKHPLEYKNTYQLLVMVVLSAQDSDRHINQIAPDFFRAFPTMAALSKATEAAIEEQISDVRNFGNKAKWLSGIAKTIKKDADIPLDLASLTALKGIGRKSANVILRESGRPPEGIIVDLHVVRVAPRLGIATGTDANKIEKQMMEALPQKDWDAGMALSFLGREICRPTHPKCTECVMNAVCEFYNGNG
ncbi:endonuclease III domain-containing protein [Niabella soli]|uniref:DNA lyase n=1 Tax=Niabella soli DSM 19437 TaxID=929713 RepID=W0F3V0_9BACT|nr:endonuclease III [Niabella soli]AHF16498.1 DNA lyase [Niabella soli DSM 19437]